MTRDEIVALFRRRIDAIGRRDVRALMELYANDCVVESPTSGTVMGGAAIEQVYTAWFTGFPDLKIVQEQLVIDGDHVVQIVTLAGTDTGGFMGLAPTGKPFRLPIVLVFTFNGGKIVHERRIYDFTGLLVQVGILKAKPL